MIENILERLMTVAVQVAILGNLVLAIWSLVGKKHVKSVLSLLGMYLLVSIVVLGFLADNFFHGVSPPYVDWILNALALLGVAVFAYLFHLLTREKKQMGSE